MSTGLSFQQKKRKIDFQDGGHLGFWLRTTLAFFCSTRHPYASYQVTSQLAFQFRRRRKTKGERKKGADLPTLWQTGDEIETRTFIFLGLSKLVWFYLFGVLVSLIIHPHSFGMENMAISQINRCRLRS